jgi:hypothetical protein
MPAAQSYSEPDESSHINTSHAFKIHVDIPIYDKVSQICSTFRFAKRILRAGI